MFKTNVSSAYSNSISNGNITLEESLMDYPKLTIVKYVEGLVSGVIGSSFSYGGLSFSLESFTLDINPLSDVNNKVNIATYTYVHQSKKLMESNFSSKDFINEHKNSYVKKTETSYWFSIGTVIAYAASKTPNSGTISSPYFLVEFPRKPSLEDSFSLKDMIDSKLLIGNYVYRFSGSNISYQSLGGGGSIGSDYVSNINVGLSIVSGYNNTLVNWSKKEDYNNTLNLKKFVALEQDNYVTYEGDYEPHIAPTESDGGIKPPRDLSIMFDNSGVTKSCRIIEYRWGQPEYEISATFGYAHAALELVGNPEKPNASSEAILGLLSENVINSGNAYQEVLSAIKAGKLGYPDDNNFSGELVWRLISIKETKYIYENFSPNISPVMKNSDGTLSPVTIPDQYKPLLESNLQVLVKEQTVGWELKRFSQEDPVNWTNGSVVNWIALNALVKLKDTIQGSILTKQQYYYMLYKAKVNLELYLYRKIPIWEEVNYALAPYSKYYKDLDEVDWEVITVPKSQLYPNSQDDTPVNILIPDPNWTPELMIVARSRYKTSVGLNGNPDYNPFARNYYGSNPITITTGTEEYELTKYGILPSKNTRDNLADLYTDYSNLSSVLSGIRSSLNDEGTYYKPHSYMDVGEYGIIGKPPYNINVNINSAYPNKPTSKDDEFSTLTVIRAAQDNSYKSHIKNSNYNISEGRPPKATLRKPLYKEEYPENNNPFTNSVVYITSNTPTAESQSSINIPYADNIHEAVQGARFKLITDMLQNGSSLSAQVNFLSRARGVNCGISIPGVSGNWIVKKCISSVQYADGKIFNQNTSVEAGIYNNVSLSVNVVKEANTNNESDKSTTILINPNLPFKFGTVVTDIPSDFGRWLDT